MDAHDIFPAESGNGDASSPKGGLTIVGSHVGTTTRQVNLLKQSHAAAHTVELDVQKLLDASVSAAYLNETTSAVLEALRHGDVIVHASRVLVKVDDAAESLNIARTVSAGIVSLVNTVLKTAPPRFVIAKGGITSSDVAAHGLEIRHAVVRGLMLPGIVSLWEAVEGPAKGPPYVVFGGNWGNDDSLVQVVQKLSNTF